MTSEESELKLALDILLDDMVKALAALKRRQNRIVDLRDPEYALALDRYELTRLRWLVILNDLWGHPESRDAQTLTQIEPDTDKSGIR
jgi:hypothetical protein